MTEGQLASRTNDPLVARGKGPMTDTDLGTIISATVGDGKEGHNESQYEISHNISI